MWNKWKSLRIESKSVLYSSKEQNAFLRYDITMGENQIPLQLTRDVQQGPRELKESFPSHRPSQDTYHYILQNRRNWNLCTVPPSGTLAWQSAAKVSF